MYNYAPWMTDPHWKNWSKSRPVDYQFCTNRCRLFPDRTDCHLSHNHTSPPGVSYSVQNTSDISAAIQCRCKWQRMSHDNALRYLVMFVRPIVWDRVKVTAASIVGLMVLITWLTRLRAIRHQRVTVIGVCGRRVNN